MIVKGIHFCVGKYTRGMHCWLVGRYAVHTSAVIVVGFDGQVQNYVCGSNVGHYSYGITREYRYRQIIQKNCPQCTTIMCGLASLAN